MFKNKANQVRSGWLILASFIIMYVGQMIFMLPGITLISIIEISSNSIEIEIDPINVDNPWLSLLTLGAGSLGGIAATLVAWRAINKQNPLEIGLRGSGKDFLFGLFLGAASITIIFFFLLLSGNLKMINGFAEPEFSMFTLVFLIIFIFVGFFEEMFFRGYIMKTMASRRNKKWLIYVVSALIFSLVHGTNPNVSLLGLINILLVGILFAYMFDKTKSLLLPIGYHITWNYFQGNVFGFPVSGINPHGLYKVDVSDGSTLLTGGAFGLEGGLMATVLILFGFIATYLYVKNEKIAKYNHSTIK